MPSRRDDPGHPFVHFAEVCAADGHAALYAVLSRAVADDADLLALTREHQSGQSPANLLFGAVHDLLLGGADHPLREYYKSVGGRKSAAGAFPEFRDFCMRFTDAIVERIRTGRVQTNEVGRCGVLLPGFAAAHKALRRPLHLVEIGPSAGLLLCFDRYLYEYSDGQLCGDASSPAVVRVELRGGGSPRVASLPPPVVSRVGVDVAPVEVRDDEAMRWIAAMIWPDAVDRLELLRAATTLARRDPPRLVRGDGIAMLAHLVDEAPHDAVPCVYHSHAIYQMKEEQRLHLREALADLGCRRDLAHVSLEWLGDDPGPKLHLATWRSGEKQTVSLADCHHHGRWLRWRA